MHRRLEIAGAPPVAKARFDRETVERIVQCAGRYPFEEFVIETNNFQDLLVGNLSRSSPAVG